MKKVLGKISGILTKKIMKKTPEFNSTEYWQSRYDTNGTSGAGSYNHLAEYKAEVLNAFVKENGIPTVIEFGCGDGNQLLLSKYPKYIGYDVSQKSVEMCRNLFSNDPTKSFFMTKETQGKTSELSLSLDVIYHLVEDTVFEKYMDDLFSASSRYVVIYSSDTDINLDDQAIHVRHREFSSWIEIHRQEWKLIQHIPNKYPMAEFGNDGSFADFYIYQKQGKI